MAEQAQSKLGELFVDIGSSGLGTLVKGLNSLSASFLLAKKGGQELLKPIVNLDKNVMSSVRNYDKLNAITGVSRMQLQRLDKWAQLNGVSFDMLAGQIETLQSNLRNIQLNGGGRMNGLALLGIDPRTIDPAKPLEALDKIRQRVQQINDPSTAALALDLLGLSRDFLDVWSRMNDKLDERVLLTEQEMGAVSKQQDLWNSLKVTATTSVEKIISKQTWLNDLLQKASDWLNTIAGQAVDASNQEWFGRAKDDVNFLIGELKWLGKFFVWIDNMLQKAGQLMGKFWFGTGEHGLWEGGLFGKSATSNLNMSGLSISQQMEIQNKYDNWYKSYIDEAKKNNKEVTQEQKKQVQKQSAKPSYKPIGNPLNTGTAPVATNVALTPAQRSELSSYQLSAPPAIGGGNNNSVNITVTQNITAPDPQTAANKVSGYFSGELNERQKNLLLEMNNLSGV